MDAVDDVNKVSIPIGFSSSLQPSPSFLCISRVSKFQSLSGFQVRCNFRSSNSGISFRQFQSLSGFQVRCNGGIRILRVHSRQVSIPIGFSSSLQLNRCGCTQKHRTQFQSLSGFQVRCNFELPRCSMRRQRRFNPYRVFKFVATLLNTRFALFRESVSIPIGFSSSLQRPTELPTSTPDWGFNPYRVFKFVATQDVVAILSLFEKFQSLSGFQVRCNGGPITSARGRSTGFNPYRVFKFVATRTRIRHTWFRLQSFNPYRVFKFVATIRHQLL